MLKRKLISILEEDWEVLLNNLEMDAQSKNLDPEIREAIDFALQNLTEHDQADLLVKRFWIVMTHLEHKSEIFWNGPFLSEQEANAKMKKMKQNYNAIHNSKSKDVFELISFDVLIVNHIVTDGVGITYINQLLPATPEANLKEADVITCSECGIQKYVVDLTTNGVHLKNCSMKGQWVHWELEASDEGPNTYHKIGLSDIQKKNEPEIKTHPQCPECGLSLYLGHHLIDCQFQYQNPPTPTDPPNAYLSEDGKIWRCDGCGIRLDLKLTRLLHGVGCEFDPNAPKDPTQVNLLELGK